MSATLASKIGGLALLVCAYALLVPGLVEPMLSVSGTVEKEELVELGRELLRESGNLPGFVQDLADRVIDNMEVSGTVTAFDKTRSILGTARELHENGHVPVAALIVLFSVVVPLVKALVLGATLAPLPVRWRRRLAAFANASGKWSMADVFVVAIFVAYLAGNGIRESRGLVDFDASLGPGFWYFLAYCLVSLLGTQLFVAGLVRELEATAGPGTTSPAEAIGETSGAESPIGERSPVSDARGAIDEDASAARRGAGPDAGSEKTGHPTGA